VDEASLSSKHVSIKERRNVPDLLLDHENVTEVLCSSLRMLFSDLDNNIDRKSGRDDKIGDETDDFTRTCISVTDSESENDLHTASESNEDDFQELSDEKLNEFENFVNAKERSFVKMLTVSE
jgi:U3 small nucleolar RNA-associated protein 14